MENKFFDNPKQLKNRDWLDWTMIALAISMAALALLTILFVDGDEIINGMNMNLTHILLFIIIVGLCLAVAFLFRKMIRKEISKSVINRFEKIESQLEIIFSERAKNRNRRIIQNELNDIIANSLSKLGKDELADKIHESNTPLIDHIREKSKLSEPDVKSMVSDFMDKSNYETFSNKRK